MTTWYIRAMQKPWIMIELKRFNIINGGLIEDKNGLLVFYADAEHIINGIEQQLILMDYRKQIKDLFKTENSESLGERCDRGIT